MRWVASITEEVNPRSAKRPSKTNGRLANSGLTSLLKEATGVLAEHATMFYGDDVLLSGKHIQMPQHAGQTGHHDLENLLRNQGIRNSKEW